MADRHCSSCQTLTPEVDLLFISDEAICKRCVAKTSLRHSKKELLEQIVRELRLLRIALSGGGR